MSNLWMPWGKGIKLSERLEIVHRELVAKEMKEHILEGAAVLIG
jgi:hypothetical protein